MAPMIFAKAIHEKVQIKIFNNGNMSSNFTYIDDVIEGLLRCCLKKAEVDRNFNRSNPNPSSSFAPYRILILAIVNQLN